jgi:hypothetical protein
VFTVQPRHEFLHVLEVRGYRDPDISMTLQVSSAATFATNPASKGEIVGGMHKIKCLVNLFYISVELNSIFCGDSLFCEKKDAGFLTSISFFFILLN